MALHVALYTVIFFFVLALAGTMLMQSADAVTANTSISASINSTESYINMVNKSEYIIFYPNMTSAYRYLSMAKNASKTNPQYAMVLLNEARLSAEAQLVSVYKYRTLSVAVLAITGIILAIIIYWYMRPVAKNKSKSRKAKSA